MPDPQLPEVVIVGKDGTEHVFPPGFDPKRAAAIVRGGGTGQPGSNPLLSSVNSATSIRPVTLAEKALNWLPAAGGLVGGVLGGGAAALPGAAGGAAIGGAGGEAFRQLLMRALGAPAPATPLAAAKQIGIQGATQAGAEVGGRALAAGARTVARPLMDNAIRAAPTVAEEFPDIVETAIKERLPVGRGLPMLPKGSTYAKRAMQASGKNTKALLTSADQAGTTFSPQQMVAQPVSDLAASIAQKPIAGPELRALSNKVMSFLGEKPAQMTPNEVKALKQAAQATAKPIYRAERQGAVVTSDQALDARFNEAVADGAKKVLETINGIKDSEARTQALIGAFRAIRRAENRRLSLPVELGSAAAGATVGTMAGSSWNERIGEGVATTLLARAILSPRTTSRMALTLTKPQVQFLLQQVPRGFAAALASLTGDTQAPTAGTPPR